MHSINITINQYKYIFKYLQIQYSQIQFVSMNEASQQNSDNQNPQLLRQQQTDIIQQTRKMATGMSETQRFVKAHNHLKDALAYRTPRMYANSVNSSKFYVAAYLIQTSYLWDFFLSFLSYVFMYLVILNDKQQGFIVTVSVETIILTIFCIDSAFQIYYRCSETSVMSKQFERWFYVKQTVIVLLIIDILIYALATHSNRIIRPFRILRGLLPIFYDSFLRKAFEALLICYKDLIVFVFFDTLVIVGSGLMASQIIQIPQGVQYDNMSQNYGAFGKAIFVIYALSSYESYPDNQLVAIRTSVYYYAFFIIFIIFNVFFFTVIPITIIFTSFRHVRGKILLIDQIKQQHSLILCFVTLSQQNLCISSKKLTDFLLFVYKHKISYIEYITNIYEKLDRNKNGQIQVSQFMQICKILQANSSMLPPTFNDSEKWIKFNKWVNQKYKLKQIIFSENFKIMTSILIIITFVNSSLAIFTGSDIFDIIDNFLVAVYVVEVVIKIIGLGPELYMVDKWNKLDLILVNFAVILNVTPINLLPTNSDVLFKMFRIFRIATLISIVFGENKSLIFTKIKRLLGQTAIIIPIVVKFFPIYLISAYMFGIIGMELFHGESSISAKQSPYSEYDQFSNFRSFLYSQFLMVQVLIQAGWTQIAYDHAYRFGHYEFVMIFFVLLHIVNVLILASLLKGIVWDVYRNVDQQYERRARVDQKMLKQLKQKQQILQTIRSIQIDFGQQSVQPDTLIKRQMYQIKFDLQIMRKFKQNSKKTQQTHNEKDKFNFKERKMELQQILEVAIEDRQSANQLIIKQKNIRKMTQNQHQIIQIENQVQKVSSAIIVNDTAKFTQVIMYPELFTQYLNQKMICPCKTKSNFINIDKATQMINEQRNFFPSQLNSLLGIKKSKKEQKSIILQNMVDEGLLSIQDASRQAVKRCKTKQAIDRDWVMRNTFLGSNNQELINKLEIEYFSDIYGQSFRQINKVNIQSLLKYEATLTYCLRNLLRYPKIDSEQFFKILCHIQNSFSNQMLKRGSLFKFVYQLQCDADSWFAIQMKQNKKLRVRFIKSAIWTITKQNNQKKVYYGRDIFKWDDQSMKDRSQCQQYIKLVYKSFQSLALTLNQQYKFFQSNPNADIYDLFQFFLEVSEKKNNKQKEKKLKISKIMLVVLSKEQQRKNQERLPFSISDFNYISKFKDSNPKKFKYNDSQNETFEKLKRLCVIDRQKIVQRQGIPLMFIMNLMEQVMETLQLNLKGFVYQVQNVLNKQYDKVQIGQSEIIKETEREAQSGHLIVG